MRLHDILERLAGLFDQRIHQTQPVIPQRHFRLQFQRALQSQAKGERALAIIHYAEKQGVPVVRDILVARRLIKEVRRYTFVSVDMVEPIYRILIWLREVELAHLRESQPELAAKIDAATNAVASSPASGTEASTEGQSQSGQPQ